MVALMTPAVGQVTFVLGMECEIVRLHRFGAYEVVDPTGRPYRVTGYGVVLCGVTLAPVAR